MKQYKRPTTLGTRYSRVAIIACTITAVSACAGSMPPDEIPERQIGTTRAETHEPARLNLLAGGQADGNSRDRATPIGNGKYLCTPAGFGQRSRCRRN